MSDNERMPYAQAYELAQNVMADLCDFCERIEIAGSLRRKKETIGDIEIVAIPKTQDLTDLFGADIGKVTQLTDKFLYSNGYHVLRGGDKYKQIQLDGIKLDLFIATTETWGMIYTIRTGCADFSHWLVTSKQRGGAMPSNMRAEAGRLWCNNICLDTPEEGDVFGALRLDWIEPEQRTSGLWRVNAWGKWSKPTMENIREAGE